MSDFNAAASHSSLFIIYLLTFQLLLLLLASLIPAALLLRLSSKYIVDLTFAAVLACKSDALPRFGVLNFYFQTSYLTFYSLLLLYYYQLQTLWLPIFPTLNYKIVIFAI